MSDERRYTESISFATPPNGATRLAVCPDCGIGGGNIPRHDAWHREQQQ